MRQRVEIASGVPPPQPALRRLLPPRLQRANPRPCAEGVKIRAPVFFSQQPTTFETRRTMVLGFAPNRHDPIEDGGRPQRGVDSFEVGTCSGKSGFKCTTPRHLCWSFLPPLVRGLLFANPRWKRGICGAHMLSTHRFLSPENDRAERFRPILDELAALPADAAAAALNARKVPSPRGGRWYAAQVIRMRKRLAEGPRRKTRKRSLEGGGSTHTTGSAAF
jgi:hypothetical protein